MRLTSASMGQDLTWLLRDAGPTVPLEAARRAVLAAAGAVVTVARCEAYDPVDMSHRDMISIRADPGDQGRLEGLARLGTMRIGAHVFQVIPFTYLRAPGGGRPSTVSPTAALHAALADTAPGGRFRGYDMEVTALRQPTGDDGGDLGPPTAFILPTTSPIAWAGAAGPRGRAVEYTHPALRTTAEIWLAADAVGPALTATLVAAGMPRQAAAAPAQREHLNTSCTVRLMPGDTCLAAVSSGATVTLSGPGETVTILLARAAWIRCGQPTGALRSAADRQCSTITAVRVEGLSGELWLQSRGPVAPPPPSASAPAWTRAPQQGTAPEAQGAEAADAEAWMQQRLGLPAGTHPGGPRGTANAATTAADAALRDLVGGGREGGFPPGLGVELGAWLTLHVARHRAQGPPERWQWASGLTAWLLERAGLVELLGSSREEGHALLLSAGFGSTAIRHHPFTQWARGRASCPPGCSFYGMRTATAPRSMHLQRALQPETLAMLDALAEAMDVDTTPADAVHTIPAVPPTRPSRRMQGRRPGGGPTPPAGQAAGGRPPPPLLLHHPTGMPSPARQHFPGKVTWTPAAEDPWWPPRALARPGPPQPRPFSAWAVAHRRRAARQT